MFGATDFSRWSNVSEFEPEWAERSQLIARLVPKGSRIIELGAGAQLLKTYLHPSCTYYAADLFDRGHENTIVFDLNSRPLPSLKHLKPDVLVLAGVLEYIADVRGFVDWLSDQTKVCIASYECASTRQTTLGRIAENMRRAGAGWVNTFTAPELTGLFESGGFGVVGVQEWVSIVGREPVFIFQAVPILQGRTCTGDRS
jgi:hypothetical protein